MTKGNGNIGSITTMGNLPLYGCVNPCRKINTTYKSRINWKMEIRTLMRDFSFPKDIIESVIRTTEIECPHENADMKYNHAWRKFWTLIG